MATIARVIKITGQLASKGSDVWLNPLNPYQQWQCQIYSFCNSLSQLVQAKDKQWLDVMLAAVVLTGTDYHGHSHCIGTHPGHQYCKHSWIHDALDFVSRSTREFNRNSTIEVASLFSALLHCNAPPTERHLDLLLRVLPKPGDMSKNAAHLLLHNNVINWFQDIQLQRILQDHHVWASLMRIACNNPNLAEKTIKMGHTLGNIAVWQSHIREELCSWITVFFLRGEWSVATDYNWALSELWKISSGYRFRDDRERTLGLTFVALSKVWKDLDFDVSGALYKFVQMLRCTGYAVLVMGYWSPQEQENKRLTPEFIGSFSVPLHDTLIEASEIMKHTSSSETISLHKKESFKSIAKILEHMADKMPTSPDLGIRDAQVYEFMARKELDGKLNALETFIGDDI
ncbi:hypothetical protein K438DRAFT_361556 [Mycena galopus ATCC 62051]|nr:hypothetical protein K438DRAFT_361556 [Mycena galopus ATCC 62051]